VTAPCTLSGYVADRKLIAAYMDTTIANENPVNTYTLEKYDIGADGNKDLPFKFTRAPGSCSYWLEHSTSIAMKDGSAVTIQTQDVEFNPEHRSYSSHYKTMTTSKLDDAQGWFTFDNVTPTPAAGSEWTVMYFTKRTISGVKTQCSGDLAECVTLIKVYAWVSGAWAE
jgi:hypothetical protein